MPIAVPWVDPPAEVRALPQYVKTPGGPDYSLDGLIGRAEAAKAAYSDYLIRLAFEYTQRRVNRLRAGVPAVAFCGMGRAGKDTSGEYVCQRLGLVYPRSASWLVLPLVAHMIGVPKEAAWEQRHQHRHFWIYACNAIRHGDVTLIGRMCLGAGDVLVGPRAKPEFHAYFAEGVLDWAVWVDRDVPKDPTVEFEEGDCDVTVANHGTVEQLYAKLDKLMPVLYDRRPTQEK